MNNSEFERRVFANPDDTSEDFLQALSEDPERQDFLSNVKTFDQRLIAKLNGVAVPTGLAERLKNNVDDAEEPATPSNVISLRHPWYKSTGFALAASIVFCVGIAYVALFRNTGPSSAELAFGQQVLDHVYMELDQFDVNNDFSIQLVAEVVANVGGQFNNNAPLEGRRVLFAKPCVVVPQSNSVHLVLQGNEGAVNVVVVKNTPVHQEFSFSDERFDSVVIPFEDGNLILVGEKAERLTNYREMLASNFDWI